MESISLADMVLTRDYRDNDKWIHDCYMIHRFCKSKQYDRIHPLDIPYATCPFCNRISRNPRRYPQIRIYCRLNQSFYLPRARRNDGGGLVQSFSGVNS